MEHSYDLSLVLLSVILSIFASFTALGLVSRITDLLREKTFLWLSGGSAVMGVGIWSMHFVGMLAFHLPIPLSYDIVITGLSVFLAIFSSGISLTVAISFRNKYTLFISALIMGLGISGMHYTGMAALQIEPPIQYNLLTVIISVLIAVSASYFALYISTKKTELIPLLFEKKNFVGSIILGAAISGMHYTGMAAAHFDPASICMVTPSGIDSTMLAFIIGISTVFVVVISTLLLSFDIKIAKKNAFMVKKLQDHNENLQREAKLLASSMIEQVRKNARKDRMLAAVVEQTDLAVITVDLERVIMSWNRGAERIFGFIQDHVMNKPLDSVLLQAEDDKCEIESMVFKNMKDISYVKYNTNYGSVVYVNINSSPLYGEDAAMIGTVLLMRDVTAQQESHRQLALWSSVYKNSSEGILITNFRNEIVSINDSFTKITGYNIKDVINKHPNILSSGLQDEAFYKALWLDIKTKGSWKGEIWNKRKNGEIYPEWLNIATLRDRDGKICNYIGIFSDATEYKEKEERISHMAYHDNLTDLPNRALMEDRVNLEINHSERTKTKFAIIFIDLDRFKHFNDTYGHARGDQLLQEVAKRLSNVIRTEDTVSRLGGDEFIIMIRDVGNIDTISRIAQKILDSISKDFSVENDLFNITPSIGIAMYPDDGNECEELIHNADTAMYHAKELGRNNYQFFTPELNKKNNERIQIENSFESSLAAGQFKIFYQPQINISRKKVVGAEALVRWFHPELGSISPARFVSLAEETGKINLIGNWILESALEQFEKWSKEIPDFKSMNFSINISPRQLDSEEFLINIKRLLKNISFPPEILEIEITETAIMKNVEMNIKVIRELKELGISIAIDDFGSGYSSLSYLKDLPIDKLKIDKTFLGDISGGSRNRMFTEAIVRLARTLNLSVIAEGAETQEHEDFLLKAGCETVQGFFYSEAVPPDEFIDFMNKYNQSVR